MYSYSLKYSYIFAALITKLYMMPKTNTHCSIVVPVEDKVYYFGGVCPPKYHLGVWLIPPTDAKSSLEGLRLSTPTLALLVTLSPSMSFLNSTCTLFSGVSIIHQQMLSRSAISFCVLYVLSFLPHYILQRYHYHYEKIGIGSLYKVYNCSFFCQLTSMHCWRFECPPITSCFGECPAKIQRCHIKKKRG